MLAFVSFVKSIYLRQKFSLMKKLFPIVFTCDDKYFKYTNVVITSILENRNKHFKYEINIVSEGISNENKEKSIKQIENVEDFEIKFIDLNDFDSSKFYLNSYMSASTYYRFYIPEIFKNYERILYLDSDLIVDSDISDLMSIPFEEKLALCTPSSYIHSIIKNGGNDDFPLDYFKETLGMNDPLEYFNAGVMVYNIRKINEIDLSKKLFDSLEEIKEPKLQDQDLLNSVMAKNGGIKFVDQRYNNTRAYKLTSKRIFFNRFRKYLGIIYDPWFFIYHYVGKDKPWMSLRGDSYLFDFYAKKSPFYNEIIKENRERRSW